MFLHRYKFLKNKLIFFIFNVVSVFCMNNQNPEPPIKGAISFGDISFDIRYNKDSNRHYIWIHGDEKTAKMAIMNHLKFYPGKGFFINSQDREVNYLDTKIDPNRIFSRSGSFKTLKKFKPEWAPGTLKPALDKLDIQREKFLENFFPDSTGLVIAVHNNSRGYNVKDELKFSTKVSLNSKQSSKDFIICTYEGDFEKLAVGPYNVVLQDKLPSKDNGSLSWAALRNGIRYINVETRLGWRTKQEKMLEFIIKSLDQ